MHVSDMSQGQALGHDPIQRVAEAHVHDGLALEAADVALAASAREDSELHPRYRFAKEVSMPRLALLTVALIALAIPGTVAGEPPQDFVTGSGWVAYTDFPSPGVTTTEQQIVSAHSGPNGESPQGTMILHSPLGDQRANVTCRVVAGNVAVVGGEITSGFTYQGQRMKY